jgi:hypothetical protein
VGGSRVPTSFVLLGAPIARVGSMRLDAKLPVDKLQDQKNIHHVFFQHPGKQWL